MHRGIVALALVAALSSGAARLAAAQPVHQHQHAGIDPAKLGIVKFENSCSPAVQNQIGLAMALLHSFWYEEVDRRFREVAKADPGCVIAWWGVAMAQWQPIWEGRGPSREALARGQAAIEHGRAIKGGTTRENDYLEALAQVYANADAVDHVERVLAYERAMEQLRRGIRTIPRP